MMNNPNQFHRKSIRLKGFDYTREGVYFITIGTKDHKCIFGKIIENQVHLSRLGKIVHDDWQNIPAHFHNVDVEPFEVMPNHIHGLITILADDLDEAISQDHDGTTHNFCRGTISGLRQQDRAPTRSKDQSSTLEAFGRPVSGSIPTIVRTFKAAVTRIVKTELGIENIWQRNYYEHIVRNQLELEKIYNYILSNPDNWIKDPEYHQ